MIWNIKLLIVKLVFLTQNELVNNKNMFGIWVNNNIIIGFSLIFLYTIKYNNKNIGAKYLWVWEAYVERLIKIKPIYDDFDKFESK